MGIPFILVGAPRTGSTLLVRTLHGVEGVCCHGELLNDPAVRGLMDDFEPLLSSKEERAARARQLLNERNDDPIGFIEAALNVEARAVGFKALYGALLNPRWDGVIQHLLNKSGVRFIHLKRENALRRYVSERVMREGGPNHSAPGGGREKRVTIQVDIDAFNARQAELEQQAARVEALLRNHSVRTVSYEALAADVPGTVSSLCRFLGVETTPTRIEPALEKVGASDLRDVVTNFDELLADERTHTLALTD